MCSKDGTNAFLRHSLLRTDKIYVHPEWLENNHEARRPETAKHEVLRGKERWGPDGRSPGERFSQKANLGVGLK